MTEAPIFDVDANINGTHLRGYLTNTPYSFPELVARLITLTGQKGVDGGDAYKASVEFTGTFKGEPFTLYDYKGDDEIHIGGSDALDVEGLMRVLGPALASVTPTPYTAKRHYDEMAGTTHGFTTPTAEREAAIERKRAAITQLEAEIIELEKPT